MLHIYRSVLIYIYMNTQNNINVYSLFCSKVVLEIIWSVLSSTRSRVKHQNVSGMVNLHICDERKVAEGSSAELGGSRSLPWLLVRAVLLELLL